MERRNLVIAGGTLNEQAAILASEQSGDPQFLHAVLCQLGLPRSSTVRRTFERTSGRASLRLQAGAAFDGMKWIDQPLPSGTRPRLVLINLCSEAVRTRSPDVDIGGSVREFLRRLNIDVGGKSMREFRKQMVALSVCHMTLAMPTPGGAAQIDAKPIDSFLAWHTDEAGQQALWPGRIRLTDKFFDSLQDHAVPLDSEAIGHLQNSALALDVYSWLAHRLWRVREPSGLDLSWSALQEQFGMEYRDRKNFKREFTGALHKAMSVYKDARIDAVPGGIRLLPSPPPVRRTRAVVTQAPAPVPAVALPARIGKVLLSVEAFEAARRLAPRWDIHALEAKFQAWAESLGEPLRLAPDKAFLGWVKSFTKGKPPA